MFDGTDFVQVGNSLHSSHRNHVCPEAMLRSAIGRYYYACFHLAREKLVKKKDWKDSRKTQHWKIAKDLGTRIDAELGDWYQQLLILRTHADYHSWSSAMPTGEFPLCKCPWNDDVLQNANQAKDLAGWILERLRAQASETQSE
jgi:hypothetical protein